MGTTVYVLWLEGSDPERLSALPALDGLAAQGITARLTPLPLAEKVNCYYQTLTGMGSGKTGRFDATRPVAYQARPEADIPEGVWQRALPDLLRAHGLATAFLELDISDALMALESETAECVILRLRAGESAEESADTALLDAIVRRCQERAGPSGHVMMLTDTGSQAPARLANVNDFLADVGLLDRYDTGEQTHATGEIRWRETLAYGLGAGQVWINMRGREPQGIVAPGAEYEEVCNALIGALRNDWRDPTTGEPVVAQALRKEDAYTGEYLFRAPDLVITWRPGYAPSARAAALRLDGAHVQVSDRPGARAASAPYAQLIASGPAFLPGGCAIGRLVDVVPSVLYLFGLPIPAHLDGHVMSDLFSSAYRDQTPIIHASAEAAPLSMEEEETIVDRLAALGYLG